MFSSKLLEISEGQPSRVLSRVPLSESNQEVRYDEAYLESLLFEHPEALPIDEIDEVYANPIPVCRQLATRAGILDALYLTRSGRIVIVEAKLWRNPESKRKVVAQLLDYASELARWSYDDLEREVSRRIGTVGTSLFNTVCGTESGTHEAAFVDNVTRSLRLGRFLLLICGDGIREGLGSIAEFLESHTTLDFTFGLVEVAIFDAGQGRRIVSPRVLARSVTIRRQVIRIESDAWSASDVQSETEASDDDRALSERESALLRFWSDLAERIRFNDPGQMPPRPSTRGNVTLRLPSSRAWITLYFEKQSGEQGIFLTFNRGQPGDYFYERLSAERAEIDAELTDKPEWRSDVDKHRIIVKRQAPDITSQTGHQEAFDWFQGRANAFVNAFRPRIARYQAEL